MWASVTGKTRRSRISLIYTGLDWQSDSASRRRMRVPFCQRNLEDEWSRAIGDETHTRCTTERVDARSNSLQGE